MNQQIYIDDNRYKSGFASFQQDESTGSSLHAYIEIFFRRKLIIICFLILSVTVTAIYTFTRIPLYKSSAIVDITESETGIKAMRKLNLMGSRVRLEKEIGILKSRGLSERYVSRIEADPEEFKKSNPSLLASIKLNQAADIIKDNKSIDEVLSQQEAELTPEQTSLAQVLSSMITVTPSKGNSNFLNISIMAHDPELARNILRNYVRLYLENDLERARYNTKLAANWLKDELQRSEEKLRESSSNLFVFTIENGILGDHEKGKELSFKTLNRSFEGIEQSQQAQTKMKALQQHEGKPLPPGLNSEYIGKLKQDIAHMESEYAQMKVVYAPSYPKMSQMRQKIQFLEDRVKAMEKQVVESSLEVAQTEQHLLERSFEQAKGQTDRIKSLEAHYTLLKKALETNTEFHKILLKEYKEADIKNRTISNKAHLVDTPNLPTSPDWPPKTLFMVIGVLVGVIGGLGMAIAVDKLDPRIQSPVGLERQFGIRKLGYIPDMRGSLKLISEDGSSMALAAYNNPSSSFSDAIKNIHTAIYFSHLEVPAQKIVITSAIPGEGKSTIAASMATILTKGGDRRVVLIDGDLRRPKVHKLLGGVDISKGISSYVNDKSLDIDDILIAHEISGLYYITSGPTVNDPVKILASDRMGVLVEKLSDEFDFVVLDAPPILGFPDGIILSSYSDGVVFVTKHSSSSKYEVKEALDALRSSDGTRILGIVMNMYNPPSAFGYNYRYGSYYYRNKNYYSDNGTNA